MFATACTSTIAYTGHFPKCRARGGVCIAVGLLALITEPTPDICITAGLGVC